MQRRIPAAVLCSMLGLAAAATVAGAAPLPGAEKALDRPLTFERDIRPLFKHHCVHCHGEGEKLKGGLDVRLRRFLVEPHGEGGDVAVVAGKPVESEMLRLVREGEMPPKGKKLSPGEVRLLEQWIAQGAPTARPEPAEVPKVYITEEEREFWVFQPIGKVTPPLPERSTELPNPVDRFVVAELERRKLSLNAEASRNVLLRRVTLDLTGLPPNAEEIAAFEADTAPDWYGRLVERLLASPHYGERWGRHWLDLAGYSDSDGYSEADPLRPWAFQYRDYVIRSLNADKPLDSFIQEQLAGDEMVPLPYKNLGPDAVDKLAATGFLRMVPDGTAGVGTAEQVTARNAVVGETLKVVSTSLLGLSVGCAQCHDHKHDPIAQRDYYQMRAIFEPGFDTINWRVPANRLVSLMSDAERAASDGVEAEAKVIDARRKAREDELIGLVLGWELAKRPEDLREPLRAAYRTPLKERNPEQVKLLKEHPTVNQLSASSLYLYDTTYKTKHADELKGIAEEAAAVRKRKPQEQFVAVFNEAAVSVKTPPKTAVFHRGDPKNPKDVVGPGELTVLATFQKAEFGASPAGADAAARASLHRRLDYARHLTSGQHPLLTRVLVNRVWAHHFGRGIVGTPADFGQMGERPSHPELLDWLANTLVEKGWSLKQMHRLLVNSSVYKQTSARSAEKDAADPDNLLLGRMPVRRMEAEMLRDSMLVASGLLNRAMFGPAIPVMKDVDGQVILGVDTNDGSGRPTGKFVSLEGGEFRRSVYVQVRRTRPLGMLETFDFPKMEPNCEGRAASTVAPQSLALMNSEFALAQATAFADRLRAECVAEDAPAMVRRAWKLAFAADPLEAEVKKGVEFLQKQTATLKAAEASGTKLLRPVMRQPTGPSTVKPEPATPEQAALATFCQALMSTNAFLYID